MANITDRDRELLVIAWQCFETVPSLDFEKLMELAGYTTKASANACWCAVKKKLFDSKANLTENDRELLFKAWQCFKSAPKVNWAKFQEKAGYKNKASANACFCAVKAKMFGPASAATGGAAGGKKRKAAKADEGEDEKPKNKRAKKGVSEAVVKAEDEDDNLGDDVADLDDDEEIDDEGKIDARVHGFTPINQAAVNKKQLKNKRAKEPAATEAIDLGDEQYDSANEIDESKPMKGEGSDESVAPGLLEDAKAFLEQAELSETESA